MPLCLFQVCQLFAYAISLGDKDFRAYIRKVNSCLSRMTSSRSTTEGQPPPSPTIGVKTERVKIGLYKYLKSKLNNHQEEAQFDF